MPRRLALIPVVFVIVSLFGSSEALAFGKEHVYRGRTSQGLRITLGFARTRQGNRILRGFQLGDNLTCEDASVIEEAFGVFIYPGAPFSGHDVSFHSIDTAMAIHMTGVFQHDSASGNLRINEAALTQTEQAQLCTTGDLTWSALRTSAPLQAFAGYAVQGRIHVHRFGRAVARFARRRT